MLTFGVNYFLLTNQNLIILVLLDSFGSYISIDIEIARFGFHLVFQFEDFLRGINFRDFLIIDFQ